MKLMKQLLTLLLLCVLALGAAGPARAHGDAAPKHGGVVQPADDLSFELVALEGGATIYVEDHGQALPTAGFGGKLSVLVAGVKAEAPLKPAGDNKLTAAGLKFGPGAKAVAVITTPQNQTLAVRFTLR